MTEAEYKTYLKSKADMEKAITGLGGYVTSKGVQWKNSEGLSTFLDLAATLLEHKFTPHEAYAFLKLAKEAIQPEVTP